MTKIRNVMIDTETLSLRPNAAIVEVGAVYRQEDGTLIHFECDVNPTIFYPSDSGFHVDPKTIEWHQKSNRANFSAYFESTGTPQSMAQKLCDFLEFAKEGGQYELKIWCCGTDFDIPKLEHLLSPAQGVYGLPWKYSNVADYRTLRDLFPRAVSEVPPNPNKHGALSDAVHQILVLEKILAHMRWETPRDATGYMGD